TFILLCPFLCSFYCANDARYRDCAFKLGFLMALCHSIDSITAARMRKCVGDSLGKGPIMRAYLGIEGVDNP
ncbi:MAG: hypothetical protein ACRC47_03550, partial [Shewanella sp.]